MVNVEADTSKVDRILLNEALKWRCIGPTRGGRVLAVAGDPADPMVFYFGACAGGVWKTYDGGTYWENISDGFFNTASVGAIAVSDSDPNVIYAGMGEACIRGDVTYGDGVYKSTDAGKTWTHVGLEDTRHISRVRIHPKDPNIVYVAALGHTFGPNKDRGIFRSQDGGKTWEHVLFRSEQAGAADLSLDPINPRVLYAAIWETIRTPWSLESGGPDSGIFKTVDGGDTWEEITNNMGLPKGLKGRIGIVASPAKSGRVWTTIDAEIPGVFRSDNGGETWELMTDNRDVQARPWYYQHIFADTLDPDTIWILSAAVWRSIDSGRTFTQVTTPHADNHDLWIDAKNPLRMIEGNDGGACVSFNGGASWSTIYNQMTSQFYHVRIDNDYPYRAYGTQQDNSAISVPLRSHRGAISWGDCYTVGSAESGYIAIDPRDSNIVIAGAIGSSPGGGGNLIRYDHRSGQVRLITVWPELYQGWGAKDHRFRFQWTYPILFSPHDPDVLYVTGNVVFKSRDQGGSWEAISPDLTRHDPATLEPSGGPVTKDTTGAETYATIFAFAESLFEKGVFWAGSDDGLVHISLDEGKTWDRITPPDLPEWSLISMIEPSPHDAATAYMAATRYKLDDTRPMLYKTADYGKTWENISEGIPDGEYTRVIKEDPVRRGLLYAGTENGIHVSLDDGDTWCSLQSNLPRVPIYDIVFKEGDLVVATHGRAFWVLDDLTPLHQFSAEIPDKSFHLSKPRTTYRLPAPFGARRGSPGKNYMLSLGAAVTWTEQKGPENQTIRKFLDAGENPPEGVIVTYFLKEKPEGEVKLHFKDAEGALIKSFSSTPLENDTSDAALDPRVRAEQGANRFVWNLRYPIARKVPGDKATEQMLLGTGPLAPPGKYQVHLEIDGVSQAEEFEVVKDPRVGTSQDDFVAQFTFFKKIRDKLSETNDAINDLRNIKVQVDEWVNRSADHASGATVSSEGKALREKLSDVEQELLQVNYKGERDRLNFPVKLNRKLGELAAVVGSADFAPTKQSVDVFDDLSERIDVQLDTLQHIVDEDLNRFINIVHEMEIPLIIPKRGQ
jgi:photosystem II stability/assembly factor-like uncharacterized protein